MLIRCLKLMKLGISLLAGLLIAGCATPTYDIKQDRVIAVIDLVDDLPKSTYGYYTMHDGVCHVRIKKATYPACITHEVRHCFEGDWHKHLSSTQNCN